PFVAPAPIRGPHAQTLVGRVFRSAFRVRWRRERLTTPDGDRLTVDWLDPTPRGPGRRAGPAPVLLILHGLEGSSRSGYVRATAHAAAAAGLRVAALNFRSCDGAPNLLARSYHSGETGDPRYVLDRIRARHPGTPLAAVGYSLGGNVLLRLLGEPGPAPGLVAAAVASVPFELGPCATHLERPGGRLYTAYFLRSLRRKARDKARRFPGAFDGRAAAAARSLWEFDEAVTAPVHGFAGAADYYRRCSSLAVLDRIRTPTLILQARDDPFVPASTLARASAVDNPWLLWSIPPHGGHLGFLGRERRSPGGLWAEASAVRFLADRLGAAVPAVDAGAAVPANHVSNPRRVDEP
ncbi:MAG: alpha/beta fold hydrolase, partial [Gemmatimonadota bacterium]|nr:alpha/beta fold hydrolase [Gemmatimonadota bacterium]